LGGALLAAPLLLLNSGSSAVTSVADGGPRAHTGAPEAGPGAAGPAAGAASAPSPGVASVLDEARSASSTALPHWQLVRFEGREPVEVAQAEAPTTTTTTTVAPNTTTTTVPPTTTTTAVPVAVAVDAEVGGATWYAEAPAGYCASPTLPFGTELKVVDNATGAATTCTVDDREADNPGRVVDLSPEGFSQIASLSAGVVEVTISW
jgi:hypothetical protein